MLPEPQDQQQTTVNTIGATSQQALINAIGTTNHQIDWATATLLIANQKVKSNSKTSKGARGGTFASSAIVALINQPGVIGVRFYYAQKTDGTPTIVLVGVSQSGQVMTAGTLFWTTMHHVLRFVIDGSESY